MLRLRIALWRRWYSLRYVMRPDDAWERDVALANRWARWAIVPPIIIMAAAFWWLFDYDTQSAVRGALEAMQ